MFNYPILSAVSDFGIKHFSLDFGEKGEKRALGLRGWLVERQAVISFSLE